MCPGPRQLGVFAALNRWRHTGRAGWVPVDGVGSLRGRREETLMTLRATEVTDIHDGAVPRRHPLDSLTAGDIVRSRRLLDAAGLLLESTRFALVQLHEPAKHEVLAWGDGAALDRQVFSVLLDTSTGEVTE